MAQLISVQRRWTDRISPSAVVIFQILIFLFLSSAVFVTNQVPRHPWIHDYEFEKVLPLWVPWAGALGGMTISLVGVARHNHEWNAPMYGVWHLLRPLLGGVSGTVAVLTLLFVLRTLDASSAASEEPSASVAVMVVISFVIGYREETFRELVKRVVDVILSSTPADTSDAVSLAPHILPIPYDGSADATVTAYLTNAGTADLGLTDATITVTSPCSVSLADSSPISPGSTRGIDVTYPQQQSGGYVGTLTVSIGGHVYSTTLRTIAP